MALDTHTSLERFLLLQSLRSYGAQEPPSFGAISESLKTNDLIRGSDSFDLRRLEPSPLKVLYIRLLKDEAKAEANGRAHATHGDVQHNPRKRKFSSPPLETVEEASQYTYLLPRLLKRLYFSYRDDAIKVIEDEERKYRSLQREIQEVEHGEWNAQGREAETSRRDSRGASSIETLLRHDREDNASQVNRGLSSSSGMHGLRNGERSQTSQSVPEGTAQHMPSPTRAEAPLPSVDGRKGQGEGYGSGSHPGPAEKGSSHMPPLHHPSQAYSVPSPKSSMHRRYPSQPGAVPSPGPQSSQTPLPPPDRSSGSPIILPPVSGMLRSQGSSTGPLDALADMAGQQYRSPPMPSPRPVQHPAPRAHPSHLPPPSRAYVQQPYPYYDNQPYQGTFQPYSPGQMPGYYPHPFNGSAPSPVHGTPYGAVSSPQPHLPPGAQQPGYYSGSGYYQQSGIHTPYSNQQTPTYSEQPTPLSGVAGRQRPTNFASTSTSTSSTKWKNVELPGSKPLPGSPIRPRSRDISPISEKASSPEPAPSPARAQGTRSQKNKVAQSDAPETHLPGTPKGTTKTRGAQSRGVGRRGRGGRVGSTASSVRGRTRSRSVVSHADELSMDLEEASSRKIKPEPTGTSIHEDDASNPSLTADETSRKPARRRRETLRGLEITDTSRTSTKRKRSEAPNTIPPPSPSIRPTMTAKPGYVLATRNFSRTSAALINDITAHKYASLFAKPLTEREAPGYKDLIYRPQDLKSIKAAISAGSKALVALLDASDDTDASTSNTLWIPETEDIVPPKGIVNSAQLEKELMRIFANAVMFNPDTISHRGVGRAFRTRQRTMLEADPEVVAEQEAEAFEGVRFEIGVARPVEGAVVMDTREMGGEVERRVGEWRGLERGREDEEGVVPVLGEVREGGEEDTDELAGEHEEEAEEVEEEEEEEEVEVEVEVEEPRVKRRRR